MKKKQKHLIYWDARTLAKILRVMKVSLFLLFIGVFELMASNILAQNEKVTVATKKTTIREILNEIEQQSDYKFFYNEGLIDVNRVVSLNERNISVNDILDLIFKGTTVTHKVIDGNIILTNIGFQRQSIQGLNIKGKVVDKNGDPIPGVNVYLKNNPHNGVITGVDGAYSIEVPSEDDFIVFSFIGFQQQEIPVAGKTVINVNLLEDAISLDEVVAVGYGVQKRSSVTGAISSVKADELPKVANTSVTHMLSGKASGVMVRQQSAQPGGGIDIIIRGAGSINAGNEPLYVIDGFPVNNNSVEPGSGDRYSMGSRNPLNSINPNDIESIEILKDASSTAIYGARAANGVILITTKRGKEGKVNVEVSANHTVQNISKYFDMLDATGFMQQSNVLGQELHLINNNAYPYGPIDPDLIDPYEPKFTQDQIANAGQGTDWWDSVTKQGKINEYNLSISGGNSKTKYLVSANYFDQTGVVYNSDFKRFSSRINLDQKISDHIKFGVSLTGSYIDNGNIQLGGSEWENSGVLVSALQMSPLVPVYNAYGEYMINPNDAVLPNPVSYREIDDHTISKRLMASSFLEVNPFKNLSAKLTVGVDDKSGNRNNYMPKSFLYGSQTQGKAALSLSQSTDLLFNTVINYSKSINETHNLSALVGYEYQQFLGNGFGTNNTKFFTDAFGANNIGAGEGIPTSNSYKYENTLASYFGRFLYNFKEKYMMTLTLRRDGTSNFGENNKWGFFPSAALAWRASEEPFIQNVEAISNLKVRLSYGQTGNSGIGDKAFTYYAPIGNYLFGDAVQTAVGKSQLGNPDLKWETTTEFNIGVDFGFLNNRISGSFEYFNKEVDDLLAYRSLPTYSDISSVADNIGATLNTGIELELSTLNVNRELRWTTDFNISSYKNQWKSRNSDVILNPWQNDDDPIRAIYGYRTAGIVQIGQEVEHMPDALPGNIIYQDVNGFDENNQLTGKPDGKIDAADNVLLGSSDPGLMFGFGNTLEYKGFDFNFFFYGMADRILYNNNKAKFMYDSRRLLDQDHNQMADVANIFRTDNPSNSIPGLAPNPYAGPSDLLLEEADFIRLKNITLGYTMPERWFNDVMNIRVYVDAQNLWTLTNYSGVDPETDSLGSYPNQKSFSVGVNVKF